MHVRSKQVRWAAIPAVVLAIALGPAASAGAMTTPFNVNLVKNPGAEEGQGGNGYAVVDIPRWVQVGNATAVRYGAPKFPTRAEADRIGGGRKFFSCGPDGVGLIYRSIRVRGRNAAIDAGQVSVRVRARIAGYASSLDNGRVQFFPLDAKGSAIMQFSTPAVDGSNGVFELVTASAVLPAGTRAILVRLYGDRQEGNYCDAYFDNISVKLGPNLG